MQPALQLLGNPGDQWIFHTAGELLRFRGLRGLLTLPFEAKPQQAILQIANDLVVATMAGKAEASAHFNAQQVTRHSTSSELIHLPLKHPEVFDRLGEEGLERLRDGDPSVRKDWLPPDEVLRRIHDDGDEPWLQSIVTGSFASIASTWSAALPVLRGLFKRLGALSEFPSVVITATDASGGALKSGGSTREGVTFKFALSGKSFDFVEGDVTHNCLKSKFLGMKTTFYLQCEHAPCCRRVVE